METHSLLRVLLLKGLEQWIIRNRSNYNENAYTQSDPFNATLQSNMKASMRLDSSQYPDN
jgi:hypothetical protein